MIVRLHHLAIGALVAGSASAPAIMKLAPKSTTDVMVRMVPGADARMLDAAIGARQVYSMPQIGWRTVRVSASYGSTRALAYYLSSRLVLDAQIPVKASKFADTNDPGRSQQYSLNRMQVKQAWDLTTANSGPIIAIIDDGLDLKHPEFQGTKVLPGYDFSEDDDDPSPEDPKEDTHGTHVAGIAGASTNNGIGIAGVGYNSRIMPLKVFPNSITPTITRAIIYAADNGAKVINMSLGYRGAADQALGDAITYAIAKGVVVVCAAGNDGVSNDENGYYPTNYPNVISVGASDSGDRKAGFSNYGQKVLVAAPGVSIYSTVTTDLGSYDYLDGTSMASPNVAGVVALMRAFAPNASVATIRQALLSSTDYIGSGFVATGRVNAYKALLTLQPAQPTQLSYVASGIYNSTMGTVPAALKTKDNQFVTVPMTYTRGLGQTAEYVVDMKVPSAVDFSTYVDSDVTITGKMNAPSSTIQVYLYDYVKKTYTIMGQATATGSDWKVKLPLNTSSYRSSNTVRLLVRGLIPIRTGNPTSGGVFSLDLVSSSITYRKPIE